jgi:hypothetical protein
MPDGLDDVQHFRRWCFRSDHITGTVQTVLQPTDSIVGSGFRRRKTIKAMAMGGFQRTVSVEIE